MPIEIEDCEVKYSRAELMEAREEGRQAGIAEERERCREICKSWYDSPWAHTAARRICEEIENPK